MMKKYSPIIFVLLLVTLACVGLPKKQKVTPVPPLPTEEPTPTMVPPTATPRPTTAPPTAVPTEKIDEPVKEEMPDMDGYSSGSALIYGDDFSDPKQDWESSSTEAVIRTFEDGAFVMNLLDSNYDSWNTVPDRVFNREIVLDVDFQSDEDLPDDVVVGFVCGFVDNDNFNLIAVGPDGWMEIAEYKDGERNRLFSINDQARLYAGGTHLTGVCSPTQLTLYANWVEVGSTKIDALPAGRVGLFGGTYENGNAKLVFDNFMISEGPYIQPEEMDAHLGEVGKLLFEDDFSDEDTNWDVRTIDDGSLTEYLNNEYHMLVNVPNFDLWSNPNDFSVSQDVIVDVDVKLGSDPGESMAAILCNYDMDTHDDFIVAGIDGQGYAQIYEYVDREINWLYTSLFPIPLDPEINHLTAHCIGSEVALLVNNTLVGSASSSVTKRGNVGLLAGTFETGTGDFLFDNFTVHTVK